MEKMIKLLEPRTTLGQILRYLEQEVSPTSSARFARLLGINPNDYSTSKYRYNMKKPTSTWKALSFAIQNFGTWWLPFSQYDPVTYEEIREMQSLAQAKRAKGDLFIEETIEYRAYAEV